MKAAILNLLLIMYGIQLSAQTGQQHEYVCPPCGSHCDDIIYSKPGVCSHCQMVLVRKDLSKTIAFYLQDGVEVLDFAGPMEVFAYAGYKVFTVSKHKTPIESQGILKVIPDYSIDDAPKADILAFFGGNAASAYKDPEVIRWIQEQPDVHYHFSVCTGAFLLAEAGLLDGMTATTFHNALDHLLERYPAVDVRKDVRFVDNGKVITTAGISAGIDGALHLVAKLQGINAAKRTAYYMEYDNWIPGDGLILSADNPYKKRISEAALQAFTGRYEYKNDSFFDLTISKGDLAVRINGTEYPVYHEDEDIFSNVKSEPVYFQRDENGALIGYRLQPEGDLFRKVE